METLGDDIWLFSTDYPHTGSSWPNGVPLTIEKAIPERSKIKLFEENALRFLPQLAGSLPIRSKEGRRAVK